MSQPTQRGLGPAYDRLDDWFDRAIASMPANIVVAQLFLTMGWTRSAAEKIVSSSWWTGNDLTDFVVDHERHAVGWFAEILHAVVLPSPALWASVVLGIEILIVIGLVMPKRRTFALLTAVGLNIVFVLAGATNPSVFYLVLELSLVLWISEYGAAAANSARRLRAIARGSLVFALASTPLVSTLHPARVIHDPGAVLCALSLCVAAGASAARRRVRRKLWRDKMRPVVSTLDLRPRAVGR